MKTVSTIARYLLGLLFVVFGSNGFLNFIPQKPMASPVANQYIAAMAASHYMVLVFLIQLAGGLLLLINRFVPLALVLLAPIIVNILMFHGLMDPGNIAPGLVVTVLWLLIFVSVRPAFDGILRARQTPISAV